MKAAAVLAALAFLAAGCGSAATPRFGSAPGWHAGSTQHYAWASTVPYRDCANCVPPHRTIATLNPDGIAIQVQSIRGRQSRSVGTWPPRFRARDVEPGFEGVPHRYGFSERSVQSGGVARWVFVWFGRNRPTASQLARANAELARFSF